MVDSRSRGLLATRDVPPQNPLPTCENLASPPSREGESLDANPARARRGPIPRATRSPQTRRPSARLTSPKPSVSRESDPLHLLADAVDLERVDGDEEPNPADVDAAAALARRVELTRAAILEEVAWIHQTRRARDDLARVRAETRARVSAHADRPANPPEDEDPALDAAPLVALGAFARRSETRWREQIERESERTVEDRRRQRHVDARLTRLEDALAALARERKADAERTAAERAAAANAATRSHPRGMGVGGTFVPVPHGFDPRTPSASAFARASAFAPSRPTMGISAPRAFAAAGAGTRLGGFPAPQPPRPMGSLS